MKLAATRVGTRWLVRPSDLDAFFAALAAPSADSASPPASVPPLSRRAERAAESLKAMGA